MLVAMDLNASPLPEEDEETFERHIEEYTAPEEHVETAVEISRRVLLSIMASYDFTDLLYKCNCSYGCWLMNFGRSCSDLNLVT